MKRSAILQPLSREHHTALTLAKACERAAQSGDAAMVSQACQRAIRAFSNELDPHFKIEEQSLLPLLQSPETQGLVQRTLADHQQLRGLLNGLQQHDIEALDNFGKCLTAHVRFEERELFPALECLL
ncbi:MAG TPA: hemerythrin domain-containing protein [Gallionellaceae bacterium]|nr:hemerythrin domain-containing protein [Gallionellaceae bacterium]